MEKIDVPVLAEVIEKISPLYYFVKLENNKQLKVSLGKLTMHGVSLPVGAKVFVQFSENDDKGRIISHSTYKANNEPGWPEWSSKYDPAQYIKK